MISLHKYFGVDIKPHLGEVASWRLTHFREFPYLYVGTLDYEMEYLNGITGNEKSLLILAKDESGRVVGVSTAVPLRSEADIVGTAPDLFVQAGHRAEEYYYFGEVIVSKRLRGQGIARRIFDLQESIATSFGFSRACLAVVTREKNDPRRPKQYSDTNKVWSSLGFKTTDISFTYDWPTIQNDGSVTQSANSMLFWIKDLE